MFILKVYLMITLVSVTLALLFNNIEFFVAMRKDVEVIHGVKTPLLMNSPNLVLSFLYSFIPVIHIFILIINILTLFGYVFYLPKLLFTSIFKNRLN